MSTQSWISEWGNLTKDWIFGSFAAATLDWISAKVPVQPGIVALLLSTAQIATAFALSRSFLGILGVNELSISEQSFLCLIVWSMSPTATHRLTSTYTRFHRILFGSSPLPAMISGPSCVDGKCDKPI